MKIKSLSVLFPTLLAVTVMFDSASHASVRMSAGINPFASRTTYATSTGWTLPSGDWTLGIWDNNFQGDGGTLISGPINLCYDKSMGRFFVGGTDSAGNTFGSNTTALFNGVSGTLPIGYPGRATGKFTPRLHIIRRSAGKSEYLVAEAGHAPVLVCSETRSFGASTASGWGLANINGWADLYDADLEGLFFATAAVSNKDIALMAAGYKPSSVSSLSGNLEVYFPLETASLSNFANPLLLANQGSNSAVGLNRKGAVTLFADGPMLRGAIAENNTPAQVTEPTNVVALNSFQPFQIIRHLNGSASVTFTGFDYGTGSALIEIRFIDVEHAITTPWQTLVAASAGGGAAVQATISVPKGYWKTIEVRRVNSGTGSSSRPNRSWSRWAVGEVVVVWGDSIQSQVQGTTWANIIAPNGYTAKYPSTYPNTIPGDTNPLSAGMWNLLQGGGMGGGSQGENEISNNLSVASQCCVGITVSWSGATRLALWNGRAGSAPYVTAKAYCMANGGLNKPSVVTWVGNLASANANDDFYADLNLFKTKLDTDFGAGTWQLILAPVPIMYNGSGALPANLHMLRDSCRRWVSDNPLTGQFAGISIDHLTVDGVHPNEAAWSLMGPRWGNATGYLRDKLTYSDPRAGEIVNFYRSAGTLIVQVQLYAGTALSLKNPAANISGLTLSSDNFATTIPISSAVLINGTTFRITPASALPAGSLKLRYAYGMPGLGGSTLAQQGADNLLYVNAGPVNVLAIQPIWGTSANNWSLTEGSTPAGLPSPWVNQDIGSVGAAGSASYASGTFTVNGSGTDIYGTADAFQYVYQAASGDCSITARVASQTNTHNGAKAGVMIRESLAPGSANMLMEVSPNFGLYYQYRGSTDGPTTSISSGSGTAPYWVRVTRVGTTLTSYKSTNGTTWTSVGSVSIPMGTTAYIGLAKNSRVSATLGTATFDNITAIP